MLKGITYQTQDIASGVINLCILFQRLKNILKLHLVIGTIEFLFQLWIHIKGILLYIKN